MWKGVMNLNKKESKEYNTVEVGEEARRRQNGCGGEYKRKNSLRLKKTFQEKRVKKINI